MEQVTPDPPALPDVSELLMVDLLHSKDPALMLALEKLIAKLDLTAEVRSGWNSAIDV